MNRLDELLTKIINKEPIGDWECKNRLEQYLFCIVARGTPEAEKEYANIVAHFDKGKPLNILEEYLDIIYQIVPEDTGKILEEIVGARLEPIDPASIVNLIEVVGGRLVEIKEEENTDGTL